MNKIATYLQEHIQGEVLTSAAALEAESGDAGMLSASPEMVVYPRVTNDIRKVTRFAWQLAEKGHRLALTPRGNGHDTTGASIGKGIVISTKHMDSIFELAGKQKLVRVQPGVSANGLTMALGLQGMGIPALPNSGTVGGAVANNSTTRVSGKYGAMNDWVYQLEVVLANGDVLQTKRLNKRELSKKKGLQTFEGEIYRSLDALIDDNQELIATTMADGQLGNAGYASISDVKHRDGSFDLTPLFLASQGTLGIISELIMKVDFVPAQKTMIVCPLQDRSSSKELLDAIRSFNPCSLEYFSSHYFKIAASQGKTYDFYQADENADGLLVVAFDDFSERHRQKHAKKVVKLLEKAGLNPRASTEDDVDELASVQDIAVYARAHEVLPVMDGAYVPMSEALDFYDSLKELETKQKTPLYIHEDLLQETYDVQPHLRLSRVTEKQKALKLLDEYADIVTKHGGCLVASDSEGRLKAKFAQKHMSTKITGLFNDIKNVFDPYTILNPGVKQEVDMREIVAMLHGDTRR